MAKSRTEESGGLGSAGEMSETLETVSSMWVLAEIVPEERVVWSVSARECQVSLPSLDSLWKVSSSR